MTGSTLFLYFMPSKLPPGSVLFLADIESGYKNKSKGIN